MVSKGSPMLTVILAAAGLGVAVIAATVYAFATAEDGFQDDDGFHPVITPKRTADGADEKSDEALTLYPEAHSR